MRNLYFIGIILFLFSCSGQKTNDANEQMADSASVESVDESSAEDVQDDESEAQEETATEDSEDEVYIEDDDEAVPDNIVSKLVGSIGDYEVTMFYNFNTKEGSYYYNDRPNSKFKLVTKRYANAIQHFNGIYEKHIVLEEYTAKGNHTGTFDGIEYLNEYQGTFTNSKGEEFDFNLVAQDE